MKEVKVRCWEYIVNGDDTVYVTFPEDNMGYDLMSCLSCGQVYAVDISKEVYLGLRRQDILRDGNCIRCGAKLSDTCEQYPDTYLSKKGGVFTWQRSEKYPEFESLVLSFPDLLSR